MAGPTLIPAGDFRSTYAQDTTIFPTTTSRNMAILGVVLACFAPQLFSEYWLSILIQIGIFSIARTRLQSVPSLRWRDFSRSSFRTPLTSKRINRHPVRSASAITLLWAATAC